MAYEKELHSIANKIQYLIGRYFELLGAKDRRATYLSFDDETRFFWGKTTKKNIDFVKSEAEKNST